MTQEVQEVLCPLLEAVNRLVCHWWPFSWWHVGRLSTVQFSETGRILAKCLYLWLAYWRAQGLCPARGVKCLLESSVSGVVIPPNPLPTVGFQDRVAMTGSKYPVSAKVVERWGTEFPVLSQTCKAWRTRQITKKLVSLLWPGWNTISTGAQRKVANTRAFQKVSRKMELKAKFILLWTMLKSMPTRVASQEVHEKGVLG